MTLGPHAGFIVAAYAVTVAVVALMILWIVLDNRTQRRRLADLEARGVSRRSSPRPRAAARPAVPSARQPS